MKLDQVFLVKYGPSQSIFASMYNHLILLKIKNFEHYLSFNVALNIHLHILSNHYRLVT